MQQLNAAITPHERRSILQSGYERAKTCWALNGIRDDEHTVATEREKFQGTWAVERDEAEGKEVPIDLGSQTTLGVYKGRE